MLRVAYTEAMVRTGWSAVRFVWRATAGYRLRPWRSPYLRWRLETYTGKPAATVVAGDFARLAIAERGQMLRFLKWLGAMNRLAGKAEAPER